MVFNSLTFIFFFAVVLALHQFPFSWRVKKFNLLAASYIFYAAWNPPFVLLLWLVTLIDWFVAKWIYATPGKSKKKTILLFSLVANLGILGYFKYGEFLLRNFVALARIFGIDYNPPEWNIVLPIGISFYTFVTLSYTIDVYRGKLAPAKSFIDYCLLVTFFPHLVAGPILRAAQFLPQCAEPKRANSAQMGWGLSLLVFGLFEKVILADGILAPVVDKVFHLPNQAGAVQALMGTFAFAVQVFLDFSGYSLCAIGAALCFGFVFPDNFRFPFGAVGFADFWQRWHISLTSWLGDYVFNSLPGKRSRIKVYRNIIITMLLAGLWHGAAWHYIVWGGVHGVLLAGERIVRRFFREVEFFTRRSARLSLAALTFCVFCLTGVLFRPIGLENALLMYKNILVAKPEAKTLYTSNEAFWALAVVAGIFLFHWKMRDSSLEEIAGRLHWAVLSLVICLMLLTIILIPGESRAFVYFQF